MMKIHTLIKSVVVSTVIFAASVSANPLFSLENLERERASLLSTLTDANIDMNERATKSTNIYRRLTDIERMVLRDERITQSNKRIVKKAFESYDLTFLVHASAEQSQQPLTHWLYSLNLSSAEIQQARLGNKRAAQ